MATFSGWRAAVLRAIGAPVTRRNLYLLRIWQLEEGGTAKYNPLNTTQSSPGATNYNSVGVKNYASAQAGVAATAKTLKNGHYSAIVRLLRQGDADARKFGAAVISSPWGTSSWPNVNSGRGGSQKVKGRTFVRGPVYPVGRKGSIIGTPYSGTHTLGNWQSDNAIDIGVPIGTPIVAVRNGKIGRVDRSHEGDTGRFGGDAIYLSAGGNQFWYKHLLKVVVKPGQQVRAGQIIGYSGIASGTAHLHFAMEHGNPLNFIKGLPVEVGAPKTKGMPAVSGGGATEPAAQGYQPHFGEDLAMSGILGSPGQELVDTGSTPQSIANIWQSLANLQNASPETINFAQRASSWNGQ